MTSGAEMTPVNNIPITMLWVSVFETRNIHNLGASGLVAICLYGVLLLLLVGIAVWLIIEMFRDW